ncbi:YjjG family noncanonical pyrimidine nucleotidase [Marinigracilibium pacificum]|uniref:Noncanonical pyrimidine nucleotidase, YjjG family n=1 Tax=Marinigracilibium pacificum TaxID=2729599 RepID=A0A848J339_9BACT|nr:YjjG family noncanonical pyrimidine nucleotidase [Marinigracilibium pacificum]NMM48759.1 noncanonical pyrimidine nucleotidase, YjjG family [Marinigracilibium pacificum]
MKESYKHIFFDLDHTLWDFEVNSRATLTELYFEFGLCDLGDFLADEFISVFEEVNFELWDLYNKNQIDKETIRDVRFVKSLEKLGIAKENIPTNLGVEYLLRCPTKPAVIKHTFETLEYLKERYKLHVITNGFKETQATKLKHSGLESYFTSVVTSECTGYKKPQGEIFRFALDRVEATPEESLMIGDNLETDVKGALNNNIDAVYFNPEKIMHNTEVSYEISCLSELKHIL